MECSCCSFYWYFFSIIIPFALLINFFIGNSSFCVLLWLDSVSRIQTNPVHGHCMPSSLFQRVALPSFFIWRHFRTAFWLLSETALHLCIVSHPKPVICQLEPIHTARWTGTRGHSPSHINWYQLLLAGWDDFTIIFICCFGYLECTPESSVVRPNSSCF